MTQDLVNLISIWIYNQDVILKEYILVQSWRCPGVSVHRMLRELHWMIMEVIFPSGSHRLGLCLQHAIVCFTVNLPGQRQPLLR